MNATLPVTNLVVYAKDVEKVATFYRRTLSLEVLEREPAFVVVGSVNLEISVVRMPDAIASANRISEPPRIREQTPLKFSFLVSDLDHVRMEAAAAGGGIKPIAAAWCWRGQLHLDGFDPEGNVVQFRRRDVTEEKR